MVSMNTAQYFPGTTIRILTDDEAAERSKATVARQNAIQAKVRRLMTLAGYKPTHCDMISLQGKVNVYAEWATKEEAERYVAAMSKLVPVELGYDEDLGYYTSLELKM